MTDSETPTPSVADVVSAWAEFLGLHPALRALDEQFRRDEIDLEGLVAGNLHTLLGAVQCLRLVAEETLPEGQLEEILAEHELASIGVDASARREWNAFANGARWLAGAGIRGLDACEVALAGLQPHIPPTEHVDAAKSISNLVAAIVQVWRKDLEYALAAAAGTQDVLGYIQGYLSGTMGERVARAVAQRFVEGVTDAPANQ